MIDGDHPPLQTIDDFDIVGGQKHCGAITIDLFQQPHDVPTVLGVEVAGGLVGDQNLGLSHHRPSNGHPLSLAARQLVRKAFFLALETH